MCGRLTHRRHKCDAPDTSAELHARFVSHVHVRNVLYIITVSSAETDKEESPPLHMQELQEGTVNMCDCMSDKSRI